MGGHKGTDGGGRPAAALLAFICFMDIDRGPGPTAESEERRCVEDGIKHNTIVLTIDRELQSTRSMYSCFVMLCVCVVLANKKGGSVDWRERRNHC